tara:strand:- start:5203 stop:5718 length:516 start_codon:yes stop_codon:yes gene_type:complete
VKRFLLFVLCFCYLSLGFSQNKSSIDFVIRNLGINVDGYFKAFTINANFNTQGELLSIKGKIKVASIETGIESRDEHLLKADYFDVGNHEYIMLESTTISKNPINNYSVTAKLTIKGKTKEITLPIEVSKSSNVYKISSYFEINRKDFDIGGGSFVMSKTVKIKVVHYQDL